MLDPSVIAGLRALDGHRMAQLVESFSGRTVALVEQLRGGIEVADCALVSRTCHTLRGASATLGASRLAALCGELEVAAASQELVGGADILLQLQAEADRVRPALRAAFPAGELHALIGFVFRERSMERIERHGVLALSRSLVRPRVMPKVLTNENASFASLLKQIGSETSSNRRSANPEVGLRAVAALRRLLESLEVLQVQNARDHGWSWQEIATALGVSKQAVHKKHAGSRRLIGKGR